MRLTMVAAAGVAVCLGWPGVAAQRDRDEVTDEINRTVRLARDSSVDIHGINGLVNVETARGLTTGEIRISVRASSQAAIDRRPIVIESTANSLTIRTKEAEQRSRDREWVRYDVRARLPREINLEASSVNGNVTLSDIAGEVELSGINGAVRVMHAGSVSRLSSINGHTSIEVERLSERGLRVSSLNGGVEIRLPETLDADIDTSSVNGGIDLDLPVTLIGRQRRGQINGRIGKGGPPITISSVNGGVTIGRSR
jgi:osmotically-inducible protein OsmY